MSKVTKSPPNNIPCTSLHRKIATSELRCLSTATRPTSHSWSAPVPKEEFLDDTITSDVLVHTAPLELLTEGAEHTVEILRSSPPKHRKRRQSPSPDYHQARLQQTPTKTSAEDKPKEHTPRKDTPSKKRRGRLPCRNEGCNNLFVQPSTRDKHEKYSCKMRGESVITMESEFLVPPHDQLQLDPCQCRNPQCLKMFANERGRKKHEIDKHRYFERKGCRWRSGRGRWWWRR